MIDIEVPDGLYEIDLLEIPRSRAVSTIMADVSEAYPQMPYVGTHPANNEEWRVWQDYAEKYASAGRSVIAKELGNGSRLLHPSSGNIAERLGDFALVLINSERGLRAEAYEAVIPVEIVANTALSDIDKRRVRRNVNNDWEILKSEYRYSASVLGHLISNVLFTSVLKRLPVERQILKDHLQ